ncbi:MAG: hypothetical protein JWM11_5961 [Planctomycetaceae bacterium]|nr:hypothetical protein [Planctomycetaceae bacterium]
MPNLIVSVARKLLCLGAFASISAFSVAFAVQAKPAAKAAEKPAEHGHADHGPHDGALIELGEEEYHGEIVVDDDKDLVTIYVLDDKAKAAVLTDAKDVAINLKHAGKGVQYKLKAQPQKGEPEGKSSRYSLKSHDLIHALEHKDSSPMLRLTIKGKTYTGKIDPQVHDHKAETKK